MRENKFILGFNEQGSLVLGSFRIRENDSKKEFCASFEEVEPFVATDSYILERLENLVEGMDSDLKFEICERFDVRPSELAETIYQYDGIESAVDISLFPYSFEVDGAEDDVYFESGGCGQVDVFEGFGDGDLFVSEEFYNLIRDTWKEYHLNEIPEDKLEEMMELYEKEKEKDTDSLIVKYLEKNIAIEL
jgi:hypothetical protein